MRKTIHLCSSHRFAFFPGRRKHRRRTRAMGCLLPLLLLLCTACAPQPDPAVEMMEYLEYGWYTLHKEPDLEEVARLKSYRSFERGDDGALYFILSDKKEPGYVGRMTQQDALPQDDSGRYSIEVTGFPRASVIELTITNHSSEPLPVPANLGWDAEIDGKWYVVRGTSEADRDPKELGERYPPIEPGETFTISTMISKLTPPMMPGHYRIYVSDDSQRGWVVQEFKLTKEDVMAWELPEWMQDE